MTIDCHYQIGLVSAAVHIPDAQSLKQKRHVLRALKDRVRQKFNVSMAEVDGQDKWQVATLVFAMVGQDHRYMESTLNHLVSYLEAFPGMEICQTQLEWV